MKKLLFTVIGCLCIISCDMQPQSKMVNVYEKKFSLAQFDSICTVDSISNNLNYWTNSNFINGDDGKVFTEYLYISNKGNSVYRLINTQDDSVKLTKRVIK